MEERKANLREAKRRKPIEEKGLEFEDEFRLLKTRDKLCFLEEVFFMFSEGKLEMFLDNAKEGKNGAVMCGLRYILEEMGDDVEKVLKKFGVIN